MFIAFSKVTIDKKKIQNYNRNVIDKAATNQRAGYSSDHALMSVIFFCKQFCIPGL